MKRLPDTLLHMDHRIQELKRDNAALLPRKCSMIQKKQNYFRWIPRLYPDFIVPFLNVTFSPAITLLYLNFAQRRLFKLLIYSGLL